MLKPLGINAIFVVCQTAVMKMTLIFKLNS